MIGEFIKAGASWRVIHLLGITSLRARYARSRLGQAWLTLSNMVYILAVGVLWTTIWKMEIDEYLPYVGAGHVIYLFLAQTINESTSILIADARLYTNERRSFVLSTFSHVYRHILILAHNLPLIFVLVAWSKSAHFNLDWRFPAALLLSFTILVFLAYTLSLLCARYRDITQLVSITMQTAFLLTPVMWQMKFLPEQYHKFFYMLNPLASMLEALRNPLIGLPTANLAYASIAVWSIAAFILAYIAHRTLGRKIIFWL